MAPAPEAQDLRDGGDETRRRLCWASRWASASPWGSSLGPGARAPSAIRLGLLRPDGAGIRRRGLATDEPPGSRRAMAESDTGRRPGRVPALDGACRGRGTGVCARLLATARAAGGGARGRPSSTSCRRWPQLCLVWFAYLLGRRLARRKPAPPPPCSSLGSPIVLFQAVQPMNDITTGALWLGVAVGDGGWTVRLWPGSAIGVALLVRPNLAVAAAAAVVGTGLALSRLRGPDRVRRFVRRSVAGGLAAVPATGGGHAAELATLRIAAPVGLRRPRRTVCGRPRASQRSCVMAAPGSGTGTPLVLLATVAWSIPATTSLRGRSRHGSWGLALAAVYLVYRPFDEWWFLRFLLPAVALGGQCSRHA